MKKALIYFATICLMATPILAFADPSPETPGGAGDEPFPSDPTEYHRAWIGAILFNVHMLEKTAGHYVIYCDNVSRGGQREEAPDGSGRSRYAAYFYQQLDFWNAKNVTEADFHGGIYGVHYAEVMSRHDHALATFNSRGCEVVDPVPSPEPSR